MLLIASGSFISFQIFVFLRYVLTFDYIITIGFKSRLYGDRGRFGSGFVKYLFTMLVLCINNDFLFQYVA